MSFNQRDALLNQIEQSYFFMGALYGVSIQDNSCFELIPLNNIRWSVRFAKALMCKNHIKTLKDLLNTDYAEFTRLWSVGIGTICKTQTQIIAFINEDLFVFNKENRRSLLENQLRDWHSWSELKKEYPLLALFTSPIFVKDFNIELYYFDFPPKFISFIERSSELKALSDLLKKHPTELYKFPGLGRKTIRLSVETIEKKLRLIQKGFDSTQINIASAVDSIILKLEKRNYDIVLKRYQTNFKSYEEIGKEYNITRERVRQILARCKNSFKARHNKYFSGWRKLFLEQLIANPSPISENLLSNYSLHFSSDFYLGFLSEVFEEVPFENFYPKSFSQTLARKLTTDNGWQRIADFLTNSTLNVNHLTTQGLVEQLRIHDFTIEEQLLCFKIILGSNKYFFYEENSKFFLLRKGSIRETAFSILSNSDKPLEINELLSKIDEFYDTGSKYDSINSVMSNLKLDGRLIQFGRYTFGLEKHYSYTKNHWPEICTIAKTFLKRIKRQCYVTEILKEVKKAYVLLKSKYELVHILRTDRDIVDLGFFTFSIIESGIKSRVKIKELILDLYKTNKNVKHYLEIRDEILKIRHVRSEGLNVILKSIVDIKKYPGSFYGLEIFNLENIRQLANSLHFIHNYVSSVIYPRTIVSNLLSFFVLETDKESCFSLLKKSDDLHIVESISDAENFIISKNWSLLKIVKCILFNCGRPMYITELKWILSDLGFNHETFNDNKYKLFDDRQIVYKDLTLEYFNADNYSDLNYDLIDTFYELLLDTQTTFSVKDFISEFNEDLEQNGLDERKLRIILEEDGRFIVTNEMIMVRSL